MPTVRPYQPGQVNNIVAQPDRMTANASAESFGGAQGRALSRLGQAGEEFGGAVYDAGEKQRKLQQQKQQQVQDLTDRVAARTAANQLHDGLSNTFYNKIAPLKGLEANGAQDVFTADTKDLMDSASKNLTPKQKLLFESSADNAITSFQGRVDSHRYKELEVANNNSLIGENKVVKDDAVRDGRPEAMANAEFTIQQNIKNKNVGQSPDFTQSEINSAVHDLYATRIEATLSQDPKSALGQIEQYKDKLNPVWYGEYKNKATEASVKQEEGDNADRYYYEGIQQGMSREDILKKIDTDFKKDADRGNAITKLVNTKWAQQDSAKKFDLQNRETSEWNNLFKNVNYKIPFDLNPNTQKAMEEWRDKEIQKNSGAKTPTDWTVYHQLKTMNPEDLSKANILDYKDSLGPSEFKELINQQAQVRGGKTDQSNRFRTIGQQADERVKSMSIFNTTQKGLSEDQIQQNSVRKSRFYEQFSEKINEIPKAEQTEKKISETINDLLHPVLETREHWYSWGSKPVYKFDLPYQDQNTQVKAEQANATTLPDSLRGKQYDANKGVYYDRNNDVINTYDNSGKFLGSLRKKASTQDVQVQSNNVPRGTSTNTNTSQNLSQDLIDFVKEREGYSAKAFGDYKQNSIGYGTKAKSANEVISKEEANTRLNDELTMHKDRINNAVQSSGLQLNENQINALTSFDFNTGKGAEIVKTSKSLEQIRDRMLKYTKAGGKQNQGLIARRKAEAELFNAA